MKNLKSSFRGEPVFVESPEEFDALLTHHKAIYFCRNCGVKTSVLKDNRFKDRQRNLLCHKCNIQLTCSRKNGIDKVISPDNPIFVKSASDVENVKNGRKIKYICRQCGQECVTRLKSDRREKLSRLLCFKCQCKDTSLKNWGTEYALQNRAVLSKVHRKYNYNGIKFDSSWELAFWIYHVDNNIQIIREPQSFKYTYLGTEHVYHPDFEVNGQLYEIKGNQYFNEDGTARDPYGNRSGIFEAKRQCALKNGVKILKEKDVEPYLMYVIQKYGKHFLESFRNK